MIKFIFQRSIVFSFSILLGATLLAQKSNYTYTSDRCFNKITDLNNYTFNPESSEIKDGDQLSYEPGEVSFMLSGSHLYVKGEDIEGVYTVNMVDEARYGYRITTMSARDPMIHGHLKLIMNGKNQVDAMIFKKGSKDTEVIYYNALADDESKSEDASYYTDKNELVILTKKQLWKTDIVPFLHVSPAGQGRIQKKDKCKIELKEKWIASKKDTMKGRYYQTITVKTQKADEEGFREDVEEVYVVENLREKKDYKAKGEEDKYLYDFKIKNGLIKNIQLYLTAQRCVSYIEIGQNRYYVRGY